MVGKSRADLWSLAAIVAVEWGVETNNMKCEDATSSAGECHHLQGQPGCQAVFSTLIGRGPTRLGSRWSSASECCLRQQSYA